MLRTLSAVGVSLGVLLTASLAHAQANSAQGFGQQGEFIFSADRLMPFFAYTNQKTGQTPADPAATSQTLTQNQTNLSFFWGSTAPNELFYTVPRVGFDYTIIDNVTIGGDLILYFTLGGSADTHTQFPNSTVDTSTSAPSVTMFGIAPRGGYVLGLTNVFALWLRGGFSYYTLSNKFDVGNGKETDTNWQFALDLDPQLVIAPLPHFAFIVGPAIDIPLVGKHSTEIPINNGTQTTTFDYSQFGFAINAGIMGWIGG